MPHRLRLSGNCTLRIWRPMLPGVSPAPLSFHNLQIPRYNALRRAWKFLKIRNVSCVRAVTAKKSLWKIPAIPDSFTDPFSVLHFLIVSSFVCAFLVPCGGRVQFLFNNNSNANNNVSMPCGGLISFLQPGKKEVFPMNMLCQCPTSGFSHFYSTL